MYYFQLGSRGSPEPAKITLMPFTFRKRVPVLPFLRLNLSKTGRSWTWHFFGWSYNTRSRRQSIDLPGPVNYQTKARSKSD